jgi:hypothetical protein
VLEHIAEPIAFLRALCTHHRIRPDTAFYFEVPNALYTLDDLGIWDLIYEHVSYFTPPSLRAALEIAGFDVVNAGIVYGGQYLFIEATKGKPRRSSFSSEVMPIENMVTDFETAYHSKISRWREYIAAHGAKSMAVWGAGSKGINFVNMVPGAGEMNALVDLNPFKQGRFAPRVGTPILSPGELRGRQIRSVVVMNPLYRTEIAEMASALDLNIELLEA